MSIKDAMIMRINTATRQTQPHSTTTGTTLTALEPQHSRSHNLFDASSCLLSCGFYMHVIYSIIYYIFFYYTLLSFFQLLFTVIPDLIKHDVILFTI